MGFYNGFMGNIMLPIYDIYRGTSRFRCGRILQKSQWLCREDIERIQKRNLRHIIDHAYRTVPYYRKTFKKNGLKSTDIKCVGDLTKLPILTKNDVRTYSHDLVSRGYPQQRLVPYRSGGSGDQVRFLVTKDQLSWEIAAEYRAYGWAGYHLGDRCFMFWASPVDLSKYDGFQKRFAGKLENVFVGNTYVMSGDVMKGFANSLSRFNPQIIRGYASSVYMMAKYMLQNGIDCIRPRSVITSAETLFKPMRDVIEEAFACPVFDYYASREIGGVAAECEEHSGYHISMENVVVEFVKDGEPVSSGEKGVVLLTSLRNFGMPFIRYKIGDVGVPSDEQCECGRGLSLVQNIEGRTSDFMARYDDKLDAVVPVGPIYPVIITALMKLPLRNVRVEQTALNKLVIKAVKEKTYSEKDTRSLADYVHKYLGNDVEVEIDFVDYLPPQPSGKRASFISRINAFE